MIEFKYRPDVDGLRALAVLLVLLFHTNLGFPGGYVGVDVFFVISGFLITGLIHKETRAGTFKLSNFWLRRVRRIIPASLVVVAATLIAGCFLLFPSDLKALAYSTIAQQLFAANFYFMLNTGYFAGTAEVMPLLHTWSLAVEEQFYLFYPFALVVILRLSKRTIIWAIIITMFVSFGISEWCVQHYPSPAFFMLPTRAWELLIGGLICFFPPPNRLKKWQEETISGLALVTIILSGWFIKPSTPFPGLYAVPPCLGTATLIYVNSCRLTMSGRLLALKPVVFIGLLSYSLYLWHWPILAFIRYRSGHSEIPVSTCLLALAASFVLSYLSWRFVEGPFRKKKVFTSPKSVLTTAIATSMIVIVGSFALVSTEGWNSRFDPRVDQYLQAKGNARFRRNVTTEMIKQNQLPSFGSANSTAECVIWGDSHAMHYIAGLDELFNQHDIQGIQLTHAATPPLLGLVNLGKFGLGEKAPDYNEAVVQYVTEQRVDAVILAGVWANYSQNRNFDASFRNTIDRLKDSGASIAVIRDVPNFERRIPQLLAQTVARGKDVTKVGMSFDDYLDHNRRYENLFHELEEKGVILLDPIPYLSDATGLLRAEFDGQALYRDSHHLSVFGASRVKPMFKPIIDLLKPPPGIQSGAVMEQ